MVIFDDLHKLLLYQRLNLGFECDVCKKKFYSRLDHLQHTSVCKSVPENLKCSKCGKMFGHRQILQLHMRFHNLSESSPPSTEVSSTNCDVEHESIDLTDSEDEGKDLLSNDADQEINHSTSHNETENMPECQNLSPDLFKLVNGQKETHTENSLQPVNILELPKKQSSHTTKGKPKQVKKRIGLTKIKMEDCLRCDACSCIYIDEKDYYKHMRNFHQLDVNNSPIPQQKSKRKCRSCCKQCRSINCTPVKRPRATQLASNLIFKINMRDNIKDRWTRMVSQQLSEYPMLVHTQDTDVKPDLESIAIKTEPSLDLSHLLSQVEVKIKTEPPDDYLS